MHILYGPTTLNIVAVFYTLAPETLTGLQATGSVVEFDSVEPVTYDRLYLTATPTGVSVNVKGDMSIACASLTVTLGADILFSNVPEGASITMDEQTLGVMDNSGALDVTPTVAGTHRFTFSLATFMNEDFSIEVISQP